MLCGIDGLLECLLETDLSSRELVCWRRSNIDHLMVRFRLASTANRVAERITRYRYWGRSFPTAVISINDVGQTAVDVR